MQTLLGKLRNCSDPLPAEYCRNLGLPPGSSYAAAVRWLKKELE
jgi:hypothetical protein